MLRRTTQRPGADFRALSRAYTLIELIVVMAIIATVAAITVPRYASARQRYRIENAAQRLASDLQAARDMAQAASAPVSVRFDAGGSAYKITPASGTGGIVVDLSQPPTDAWIQSANFAGSSTLSISAYGLPSASGAVVLRAESLAATVTLSAGGQTTISIPQSVPPGKPLRSGSASVSKL